MRTAKGSLARESGGPCLESLALSACPFILSGPCERNYPVFDFREDRGHRKDLDLDLDLVRAEILKIIVDQKFTRPDSRMISQERSFILDIDLIEKLCDDLDFDDTNFARISYLSFRTFTPS